MFSQKLFRTLRKRSLSRRKTLSRRLVVEPLETRTLLAAGVTNLGLDAGTFQLDGNLAAFVVFEVSQDADLNGDGDTSDGVLHVYDTATDTTTNLGLASGRFQLDGNLVAFSVGESGQGNTDLNGDGDTRDPVFHVYDAATNSTTNLGLAGVEVRLDGNLLAFEVLESAQETDLNGDGDTSDGVLHVYDAATNSTTNLGLALAPEGSQFSSPQIQLDGNLVAFSVSESRQGSTDLNGDGDASDSVVHVYDAATDTTTNLGLASGLFQLDGNLVAFSVGESRQGSTDLNGDGDAFDGVVHVYDAAANSTTNVGLVGGDVQLDGNLVAFEVYEASQGNTDLNGDRDTSDSVLHVYNAAANSTTNLGLASFRRFIQLDGNLVAFTVREADQGNTDQNGDGDTLDYVSHVYDAVTNRTINLGLAIPPDNGAVQVDGNLLAFTVSESFQGNTDLNDDGDTNDARVLHIFDLSIALLDPAVLVNQVISKVDGLGLSTGAKSSLTSKLEAVLMQLGVDVPQTGGLVALMDAFLVGVNNWFDQGQLTEEERDDLFGDADFIKSLLEL